jgi:NADPH:quinone reductase
VRGATSALGQAVVNIAADCGVAVIATTRNPERRGLPFDLGAKDVLLDDGGLATQAQAAGIVIDAAVDLIGSSALRDTLAAVRPGGRAAGCARSVSSAAWDRWSTSTRWSTCPPAFS